MKSRNTDSSIQSSICLRPFRFKEYEDWLVENSAKGKGKAEAVEKEKLAKVLAAS